MPDTLVLSGTSPDARRTERRTELGIYEEGCSLDNVLCAFGHDEYMYEVFRGVAADGGRVTPKEALYIMRRAHTLTGDADGAHASHLAGSHLAGSHLAGSHLIWPDLI